MYIAPKALGENEEDRASEALQENTDHPDHRGLPGTSRTYRNPRSQGKPWQIHLNSFDRGTSKVSGGKRKWNSLVSMPGCWKSRARGDMAKAELNSSHG